MSETISPEVVKLKLKILADAAKYDASCASSGSKRKREVGGVGNTEGMGICHSYTPDGRCISLLKILLTNFCLYDCKFCINRVSSDTKRAKFTPEEVVWLTLQFYRRNYIEGLFLSSGIAPQCLPAAARRLSNCAWVSSRRPAPFLMPAGSCRTPTAPETGWGHERRRRDDRCQRQTCVHIRRSGAR